MMAGLPLRLLGFVLLALAIAVPGCQALLQAAAGPEAPQQIERSFAD